MPELSNLLRQRLAAGQTKGFLTHPDADALTAYAEQSLPADERQSVVLHLSQCEQCREVLALSQMVLPEMAVSTVVKPAPVSGWRRLLRPTFGLAAAVTAMAVIAVMVVQLPQKSGQPSAPAAEQANVKSASDQAGGKPADEQKPAATSTAPSTAAPRIAAKELDRPGRAESTSFASINALTSLPSAPQAKVSANARTFTAGLQKKDYLNTNFFDANSNEANTYAIEGQNNNDSAAAPQPQAGSANNTFSANNGLSTNNNGSITIFSDIPQNANGKSNLRILTPAPPPQPFGYKFRTMAEATVHALGLHPTRPAIRAGNLGSSTMGSSGMFASTLEKSQPAEVPATAEKAESGLARSDALTPGALSGFTANALRGRSDSQPAIWKVAGGKLLKAVGPTQWEDAYPVTNESIEFSFVTARGNDVWAGGSHASLVHSRDGGTTWEIVRLGKAATGTVVTIIAGASTVLVKTSDNQTWLSTDGGNTWTLRNE